MLKFLFTNLKLLFLNSLVFILSLFNIYNKDSLRKHKFKKIDKLIDLIDYILFVFIIFVFLEDLIHFFTYLLIHFMDLFYINLNDYYSYMLDNNNIETIT